MSEIVVTGLGCISAAGHDVSTFEQMLFSVPAGSAIGPADGFKASDGRNVVAAQVKDYVPEQYFNKAELKLLDRYAQFALISAEQAIKDASLNLLTCNLKRVSVVHGTSIGGQETIEASYSQLFEYGKSRTHPFTVPKLLPSSAASHIAMKYGIKGPTFTTSSACASAGHAISMAVLMLRCNLIDIAVVGGSEACLTQGNFFAWEGLRVISNDNCRPFSADRSGSVLGEGAATLVLERADYAKQRGAKIHAKLSGIGMSSDAHNIVQPLAEGAEDAMNAALLDANLAANTIDYVNAHGSGTVINDQTETKAIQSVFECSSKQPFVSSTKSIHGHVLGAGAALEAIASILAIKHQKIPATVNYKQADPLCDLNLVINQMLITPVKKVMSNSFAFGGLNSTLIFEKI